MSAPTHDFTHAQAVRRPEGGGLWCLAVPVGGSRREYVGWFSSKQVAVTWRARLSARSSDTTRRNAA